MSGDQIAQINLTLAGILARIVRLVVTPLASPMLAIRTTVTTPAGTARRASPGRVRTRRELDRREVQMGVDSAVRQAHSDRLDPMGSMPLAIMVFAMRAPR
jgi:hypothetical protein